MNRKLKKALNKILIRSMVIAVVMMIVWFFLNFMDKIIVPWFENASR